MMKRMDKKAFTLIELLVVIAVIGILVLLGIPRFIGHTQGAELTRIQHDIKVMEQEVGTVLSTDDDFNKWENNIKDLSQLIQEGKLFEKEGVVKKGEPIDGSYKVIPEKYKDKINTKLKGTFYANSDGKVYYEHLKPLGEIPTEPEKEPLYSEEEVDDLTNNCDFIPIATADELNSIRSDEKRTYGKGTKWERECEGGLDKKYIQVRNVDLSEYSEAEEGWNPIGNEPASSAETSHTEPASSTETSGTEPAPFTGTYDGGNYVITGLEVKGEGKNHQGLFGVALEAIIRNVGLIDNKVTGAEKVGGLAGSAEGGTISNSYSTGSVEGTGGYVGGLVGDASFSTISNSYATGSVKGLGQYVGGLLGYSGYRTIENSYATGPVTGWRYVGGLVGSDGGGTISNSYATGPVTGTEMQVGGLVGYAHNSTISNSYATGSVTGSGIIVGGLVGYASWESKISNSYTTGSVSGEERVGGLVGVATLNTKISNSYATGSATGADLVGGLVGWSFDRTEISNSYSIGLVEGSGKNVGGLIGLDRYSSDRYESSSTITGSYWNIDTSRKPMSAGGTGKSTDEMKKQITYSDWNFDTVWKIDEGNDYPTLR